MELEPLKQWYCDACSQIIRSAEDGWLEWLPFAEGTNDSYGFRIVHNDGACMYDRQLNLMKDSRTVRDNHLSYFLGAEGLVYLLHVMEHETHQKSPELIDIIKRLQIPYYEEGRKYLVREWQQGIFTVSDKTPDGLKRLIDEYTGEE